MANECVPFYEPGADITGHATAAVTGKRCVKISGNRQTSAGGGGGNVSVAHADAAGRIFGVASHDAAIGKTVTIKRGPGIVVPITCVGAIAAFQEVEVGANGRVTALAAGVPIGFALTAAADATDAQISLY